MALHLAGAQPRRLLALGQLAARAGRSDRGRAHPPHPRRAQSLEPLHYCGPQHAQGKPYSHFIEAADTRAITDWVRAGGTLVLLANDTANCEIKHFNAQAQNFGLCFTDQSVNMVQGNEFE